MKKVTLIFPIIMLLSFSAWAQNLTPRVNERQANQRSRIHEGRTDGDLTRNEAALLNKEQKHIRRSEHRIKADGDVSVKERRRLDRKQDRANRHIRRAKNNEATKAG